MSIPGTSSTIAATGQFPITADEAEFSASFSAIFSQSSFLDNQSCGNLNANRFNKLEVVNSSNRSTGACGSGIVQQQSAGGNTSKFLLPELKVNNNIGGGGILLNQQQAEQVTKEALSAYDRQQQQIEIAIAAAINGGSSASDGLDRNGGFNGIQNDEFMRRLIDAVKREPCLYNPSHEHYGNKHASAQFRTTIWQRLCKELDYTEDAHSLQMQWKRIRDRYVRERRRRRILPIDMDQPSSMMAKTYNMMRWIDEYLGDSSHSPANVIGGNVLMHLPSTSATDQYFDQNNCLNGAMGNGLKEQRQGQQRLGVQGGGTLKGVKKNNESNGSPSSTSSEISVGSAQFAAAASANGTQILLPQLRHIPAGPSNGGTNFGVSGGRNSHQLMYKMKEELGAQNNVQMGSDSGQQVSSYQIISIPPSNAIQVPHDGSGNYYQQQHGAQNTTSTTTSLLNNTNNNNNGTTQPPRRKRAALDSASQMHSSGQQRGGRGVHIEPERIVVNQPTHMQPVVVHPASQIHPSQQTSTDRAVSTSALRLAPIGGRTAADSAAQLQSTSSATQLPQPQYILSTAQPQTTPYADQESAFIEMIVRHLRNLNEDEKVVTKMNIQRILMDARFGRGACVRMFNDELAMEQQRHMQQQHSSVNSTRR